MVRYVFRKGTQPTDDARIVENHSCTRVISTRAPYREAFPSYLPGRADVQRADLRNVTSLRILFNKVIVLDTYTPQTVVCSLYRQRIGLRTCNKPSPTASPPSLRAARGSASKHSAPLLLGSPRSKTTNLPPSSSKPVRGTDALDRRPELAAALAARRSRKRPVIVAKLDRRSLTHVNMRTSAAGSTAWRSSLRVARNDFGGV
jgi:hypothetical protein